MVDKLIEVADTTFRRTTHWLSGEYNYYYKLSNATLTRERVIMGFWINLHLYLLPGSCILISLFKIDAWWIYAIEGMVNIVGPDQTAQAGLGLRWSHNP